MVEKLAGMTGILASFSTHSSAVRTSGVSQDVLPPFRPITTTISTKIAPAAPTAVSSGSDSSPPRQSAFSLLDMLAPAQWSAGADLWSLALRAYRREDRE